ncbi:MAG: hypothetical protein JNM27_13005 [Leptospirales bacterium]|nr:hypothetical protein [Leptospirales bacterium]
MSLLIVLLEKCAHLYAKDLAQGAEHSVRCVVRFLQFIHTLMREAAKVFCACNEFSQFPLRPTSLIAKLLDFLAAETHSPDHLLASY